MAEFCLQCLNKVNDLKLTANDVKISKDKSWCEGCGEMKNIVLKITGKEIDK